MLTVAASSAPSAATHVAADGSSDASSGGAAAARDFLTLLSEGAGEPERAGKIKSATRPDNGAAIEAAPDAAGEKGESAEAGLRVIASKIAGAKARVADPNAAGEPKADAVRPDADAAKAQQVTALPATLLSALAAGAQGGSGLDGVQSLLAAAQKAVPQIEPETAETTSDAVLAAPVRTKAKGGPAARRETAETPAKPSATGTTTPGADTARTKKIETPPAAMPAAAKGAEPVPVLTQAVMTRDAAPQGQLHMPGAQVTDARIPLGAREAAQAGFAAPVLAMRVVTKDGATKSIEIRLDPAELGKVDVKLETGHDGKLKAVLSAENAAAFELLKRDGAALEAALRDAGIDLEEGAISFALNDSGADQSHRREAAYGDAEARRAAQSEDIAAAAAHASTWRDGVIDISV